MRAELPAHLSQRSRADQQPRLNGRAIAGSPVDRTLEEIQAFLAVAVLVPEPDQGRRQPSPTFGVGQGQGPVECRPEVVVLGFDPVEGWRPGRGLPARARWLAEGEEVIEVALTGRIPFPGGDQLVDGVLTNRLQQPVAGFAPMLLDDHQRLVDQAAEGSQHDRLGDGTSRAVGAHGSCGIQREPTRERAETAEHHAVSLVEQVVAPVHRRGEGLLAPGNAPGPAHEQREPVIEPGSDLRRGERA